MSSEDRSGPQRAGDSEAGRTRPPSGSWARLYVVVIAAHLAVLLLLWWLSSAYNVRLVGRG